jgi:hypothetical protein
MTVGRNRQLRCAILSLLFASQLVHASEYNPVACQSVSNTVNINWQAVGGPFAPCTGIEFTNGTAAEAATGTISMSGVGVSNPACISTAAYTFTLANNTMSLVGFDTANNVPMTLTRNPGELCFVGHWVSGGNDYLAHIWAEDFPLSAPVVPLLDPRGLLLLIGLLAIAGGIALHIRGRKTLGS